MTEYTVPPIPRLRPEFPLYAILPDHRLALFLTPKVASSSMARAISKYYGVELTRPHHANSVFKWFTHSEVLSNVPEYKRAMFVRNPYDRLVGAYEFHVRSSCLQMSRNLQKLGFRSDMTFYEFICQVLKNTEADPHFSLQCWQSEDLGFIGRFENMLEDWGLFRAWAGVDLPDLDVTNYTPREKADYREYYDEMIQLRVGASYAHDLRAYGYEF